MLGKEEKDKGGVQRLFNAPKLSISVQVSISAAKSTPRSDRQEKKDCSLDQSPPTLCSLLEEALRNLRFVPGFRRCPRLFQTLFR